METAIEKKIIKRKPGRPSTNEQRRKEILEKSTECFIKFGFNKTTLDEIGLAIGFNKAALYYYFKNKEELFVQAINVQLKDGLGALKNKVSSLEGAEKQLLEYFFNRTKIYVKLIKLTSLSGENIIELNDTFNEIYAPFKKSEEVFVASIVKNIAPKKSEAEQKDFVTMCFDVVNSMSFTAIILDNVTKKDSFLDIYNKKKDSLLKNLIVAYKN